VCHRTRVTKEPGSRAAGLGGRLGVRPIVTAADRDARRKAEPDQSVTAPSNSGKLVAREARGRQEWRPEAPERITGTPPMFFGGTE